MAHCRVGVPQGEKKETKVKERKKKKSVTRLDGLSPHDHRGAEGMQDAKLKSKKQR